MINTKLYSELVESISNVLKNYIQIQIIMTILYLIQKN